jgi:hypothetical protein
VGTYSESLLGTFHALSTRSGYAEVLIPELPAGEGVLHAQFVWINPAGCAGTACLGGASSRSASDALSLVVRVPVLTGIEVTPTNPSIALGTSVQLTAMGTYDSGTTQDVTASVTWSSANASVASVSNAPGSQGLATSASVGTTSIVATDAGSDVSDATTLTVTPAVLVSIEVTPANPAIALGTTERFTAMGVFSDATVQDLTQAVVWSSTLESVAGVSNAPGSQGLAAGLAVGVTTIVATDPASGIGGATGLTVTPAMLVSIEVTPTSPAIALGTTRSFAATGIYTDASTQDLTGAVVWSSTEESVAVVSNAPGTQGLATGLALGTTTIAATDPGSAIGGTTTLEVTPAVLARVEVTPTNPSIALGLLQQFTAMGIYTDASLQDLTGTVTWSSSSASVAAVSNALGSEGLATTLAVGETTVTATDPASAIGGSTVLTVTQAELVSLALSPIDPEIPLGTSRQFTALGRYTDGAVRDVTDSVTWNSSSDAIATVSNAPGTRGLATSIAVGETTIAATDPGSGLAGATVLTVTPAELVSVRVTPAGPSIALGTTLQLAATGMFTDGTTQDLSLAVTWSSLDDSVAAVSNAPGSQGFATSLSVGTTLVSAVDPATSIGAATTLTVTPAALVSIQISPANPTIGLGTAAQLAAIGLYTDASAQDLTSSVTWSSLDVSVATVNNAPGSQGLATSVSVGAALVTATDPASSIGGATTLTVEAVLLSIDVSPLDAGVVLGNTKQFAAVGHYNDGSTRDVTGTVAWSSSNPLVAAISDLAGTNGLSVGLALGLTTITATDLATGVGRATTLRVIAQH